MKQIKIEGDGPVLVPEAVWKGLEAVRKSGLTNMMDRPRVAELADMLGFEEAATWVENHREEFANCIFRGVRAMEQDDGPE